MKDGHGGVIIGSEMSGSVRNVFAENNIMDSPNLDRALRMKTNFVRGGTIENIYFRNNEVRSIGNSVVDIDMTYEEGDNGNFPPTVQNIYVQGIKSNGGKYGLYLKAYTKAPVINLHIEDSRFDNVQTPMVLENVPNPVFSNFYINGKLYDNVPPQSTATVTGVALSDGTYVQQAEVKIDATDGSSGDHIEYQLAGASE